MAQAAVFDKTRAAGQPGQGRFFAFFSIGQGPCFTERRKQPGPGRTVVIGRFAPGVFVTLIASQVRVPGIVDQFSVMLNFNPMSNRPVGQAADGTRNQQFLAGRQDMLAFLRYFDCAQRDGSQLIGAQGVVGGCIFSRLAGGGMQTIRQVT